MDSNGLAVNALVEQKLVALPQPMADFTVPGSKPLRDPKMERFCRLRAVLRPKADAYRQAGYETKANHFASANASKLERRADVSNRIAYLCRSDESLIHDKQRRLEEMLWLVHEADIGDLWETVEVERYDRKGNLMKDSNGKPLMRKQLRPRQLDKIPEDVRRAIEVITINEAGIPVPKPYSKLQANTELRKLLGIGSIAREDGEASRLSDAELVAQLAAQARELGIQVDLTYRFGDEGLVSR